MNKRKCIHNPSVGESRKTRKVIEKFLKIYDDDDADDAEVVTDNFHPVHTNDLRVLWLQPLVSTSVVGWICI